MRHGGRVGFRDAADGRDEVEQFYHRAYGRDILHCPQVSAALMLLRIAVATWFTFGESVSSGNIQFWAVVAVVAGAKAVVAVL